MSESPTKTYKFSEVVEALIAGRRIKRVYWSQNPEHVKTYGLIKDKKLMLSMKDQYHVWILSDEDLMADDWVLIN